MEEKGLPVLVSCVFYVCEMLNVLEHLVVGGFMLYKLIYYYYYYYYYY